MSTIAPPQHAEFSASGRAERHPSDPGRYAQWHSSWTVALRMARRDVRRHRGRSALVVVMVLFPTLLLSTVVTLAYTSDVAGPELIPAAMGTGQARIEGPSTGQVVQLPDPSGSTGENGEKSRSVTGLDPSRTSAGNAAAIAALVGAPISPIDTFDLRSTVGDRRVAFSGLGLDRGVGFGDTLRLESGRSPAPPPTDPRAPVEALVTAPGIARGLPASGALEVTLDGNRRTLTIVGTSAVLDSSSTPSIVTAGPPAPVPAADGSVSTVQRPGTWIVRGDRPVTWADVQRLNEYGLTVTSAAVLRDPPPASALDPQMQEQANADRQRTALMVGLAGVMLLVSTTLLVGPAFAVSATRQRRTLALAASNGAHTPVLRRTVLAQALVLGGTSAGLGVVLGVGVAYVIVRLSAGGEYPAFPGPFDIQVPTLLAIALAAVASTLVAALVPARRLGRLDIVGVMRGQSVSPRPNLLVLALGVVMTLAGAALTLGGTGVVDVRRLLPMSLQDSGETLVVIGAVVLIVGSLLLVPVILAGMGRVGGRLPTALRMAARDLARHRARSAPSVGAVLAVVAGLTFGLTGLESDTEQNRREYLPQTIPGEVLVSSYGEASLTIDDIRASATGLVVTPDEAFLADPSMFTRDYPTAPYRAGFVSVVPQGCTVEQTLGFVTQEPQERCIVAGTQSNGIGTVLVLPAAELTRRLSLTGSDADRVREGALVMLGGRGDTVRLASGTYAVDPQATEPVPPTPTVTTDASVPVVHLPQSKENAGRMLGAGLAVAAGTPTSKGWPTIPSSWTVRDPEGAAVPDGVVQQLQQKLGDEVGVQREDGFQRGDRVVVAILLGVFALLILVVTLTSTALTLAEQQTDQATLAALGATRGTRRLMAAGQAFVLAIVGCSLGVAVGLVPGIAIARPLTSQGWDPVTMTSTDGQSILVIPWLHLAIVGVLVPVVAAGLAAAGIRRAPQVTRRAT